MVCSSITPSAGRTLVGHLEEVVVAVVAEVLERADRHDAVDRLVELLPALQQHPLAARGCPSRRTTSATWAAWFFAQRQADDVDVVLLDGAPHGGAPAAADVEQRHAGLAGPACPAPGRSWRSGPLPASCRRARSRRSCRSGSGRGTAGRSRRTGRSAPARRRSAASASGHVRHAFLGPSKPMAVARIRLCSPAAHAHPSARHRTPDRPRLGRTPRSVSRARLSATSSG